MSNYSETDFCDKDEGLDYIFGYMGAVYGATFTRHWEKVDPGLVRSVWAKELGRFLTYKPSLDYALGHLPPMHPPSAIQFRNTCNAGPLIPAPPNFFLTKQPTQYEKAKTEIEKAKALEKLAQLRAEMSNRKETNNEQD